MEFNNVSARVMAEHGVPVIDLYSFTTTLITDQGEPKVIRPDKVHFTPLASEAQGEYIADKLTIVVKMKTP